MEYLWALVLGFLIAMVLAFGIGANDVANSFGTSVGSKVLTLVQACIIATIFETLGAVLIGAQVSDTIRKGIIDVNIYNGTEHLLISGEISALMGSAIWLILATFLKLPVSASHSIVGSTLGFSLVAKGHQGIHWEKLGYIVSSWFVSPLLSGCISGLIFFLIRKYVLNQEKSLKAGLRVLPLIYASTFAVNLFSIFYNGPQVLRFDRIPLYGAFILTMGLSIIIGICIRIFLIPWYRKRIIENNVAAVNLLKSGGKGGKSPLRRRSEEVTGALVVDQKAKHHAPPPPWYTRVWGRMCHHGFDFNDTSTTTQSSSQRPLSVCSMSTLTTNISSGTQADKQNPDISQTPPKTTPGGLVNGAARKLVSTPLVPEIVVTTNPVAQSNSPPAHHNGIKVVRKGEDTATADHHLEQPSAHHRERKLSESDLLFINYIMPGQLAHIEEGLKVEKEGDEENGEDYDDEVAAKVGSAYAPNGRTSFEKEGDLLDTDHASSQINKQDLDITALPPNSMVLSHAEPLKDKTPPSVGVQIQDGKQLGHGSKGVRRKSLSKSLEDPHPTLNGEATPQHVRDPPGVSRLFSFLQILTGAFGAFAHGGNDVSNSIGPLIALYEVCKHGVAGSLVEPPLWILLYGGIGISLGLWIFGKPVMETMGKDLTVITPTSGFTIEIGAALTVLLASNLGIPISTTHCKVGSIVFVGYLRSKQSVDWKLFGNIVAAWVVTVPVSMALSASLMAGLRYAIK